MTSEKVSDIGHQTQFPMLKTFFHFLQITFSPEQLIIQKISVVGDTIHIVEGHTAELVSDILIDFKRKRFFSHWLPPEPSWWRSGEESAPALPQSQDPDTARLRSRQGASWIPPSRVESSRSSVPNRGHPPESGFWLQPEPWCSLLCIDN